MIEPHAGKPDHPGVERRHEPTPYGVDRRGSAARNELRFLVAPEVARGVEALAKARLIPGDVESDAPWYTTTYCDTRAHDLYRSALAGAGRLLRFREYHARRPEQALTSYRIWIEWKTEWKEEHEERSAKQRLVVRPRDIIPFLRRESMPAGGIDLTPEDVELFERGMRPVVVTQCRRVVYASRRDQLRVTFDHELTYLEPDADATPERGVPWPLGAIIARERGILIEVKWQGELAGWASDMLEGLRHTASDRSGKFVVAMQHVAARAPEPS